MERTDSTEKSAVDLESGRKNNKEEYTNRGPVLDDKQERPLLYSILRSLSCVDGNYVTSAKEERIQEQVSFFEKERHKRSNNEKASKPPRPPKGPALDAADVKLIKEISELAMKKRARIEQMKSLRKMKEIKSSKPSRSSISAMAITVLFFFVIIFQALWSRLLDKT